MEATTIIGDYYLQGVFEVGSGFRFKKDFTFHFFYSYGAIDRECTGTWLIHNDFIILTSPKKPAKDFEFLKSVIAPSSENTKTIKIIDTNPLLLGYVKAVVTTIDHQTIDQSDANGIIVLSNTLFQSLSLIHLLWPDRYSIFNHLNTTHSYFEFSILPTIVDVEINALSLLWKDDCLHGAHPLLNGTGFKYNKN